jgi:hypothetical protein
VSRPPRRSRTLGDLTKAVTVIARHFNVDQVIVIGSQAMLVGWTSPPVQMTESAEIDMYPDNAEAWEKLNEGFEASEEINALFGEGSPFAATFGFYIDGVDGSTAKLPKDWRSRAVERRFDVDGRVVSAIAPCLPDLLVSKLWRGDPKDRAFIETALAHFPAVRQADVMRSVEGTNPPPELRQAMVAYIDRLVALELLDPDG